MARPRKKKEDAAQGSLLSLAQEQMEESMPEIPVEEQPYPLPEGWKWIYWGNCGDFIAGSTFKQNFQGKKGLLFPFYKVGSLKNTDNN